MRTSAAPPALEVERDRHLRYARQVMHQRLDFAARLE